MKKSSALFVLAGLLPLSLLAQETAALKDYPIFPRVPNYEITGFENANDALSVPVSEVEVVDLDGMKTFINYGFKGAGGAKHPNNTQLIARYADIARGKGGKMVHKGENFGIYNVNNQGQDVWLIVEAYENGQKYSMTVVENGNIDPGMLFKELAERNLTLYINFPSGKSELPYEAGREIKKIGGLMKAYPDLIISIEGHTDNVGSARDNKSLSLERAQSVLSALVKEGVDINRMNANGWGQERPVASNASEDGRVRNRRVELIKVN